MPAVTITIGKRLTRFRQLAGLTRYALAQQAGIPYSTLHAVESGKRDGLGLTLRTALQLAQVLGIGLDELVGR